MAKRYPRQTDKESLSSREVVGIEAVMPNPKLKLMDQIREVMRLKHYSIRTERCYCDWIKRYIKFHNMKSRADLDAAEPKIEAFLSAARHKYGDVAQVSNLLYRVDFQGVRGKVFPCGRLSTLPRLALAARDNRDAALTLFLT